MPHQDRLRYGPYARQKLFRTLLDLKSEEPDMNWSSMAEEIYLTRGVKFQRINFYRLRDGTLSDANVEIIVEWIEAKHDKDIRDRLQPQAIFDEVGRSSRDYYFHIPAENVMEDLDEHILDEFAGVYLCAPASDKNSFIPLPTLRRWFEDRKTCSELEKGSRSLDIKQYIQERAILILQRTPGSYFYAAEFPLSLLFPNTFETLDMRMVYEGVAVVSSNTLQVQLRECLSRVPKTHSILIATKTANQTNNPYGFGLYLPPGTEGVRQEWHKIEKRERYHLIAEYEHSAKADYYLTGPVQITESPVPNLKRRVGMTFAREMVYHRKPDDFLRKPQTHFIRPDIANTADIEKILSNPLSIGGLV